MKASSLENRLIAPGTDDELFKAFIESKARLQNDLPTTEIERALLLSEASRTELVGHNRKEAEKKILENAELTAAIRLACAISECQLEIHFSRLLARMVEATRGRDVEIDKQFSERYAQSLQPDSHPYPLVLPVKGELSTDYQTKIIETAKLQLTTVVEAEQAVLIRMTDNWQEGMALQTERLSRHLEAGDFAVFKDAIEGFAKEKVDPATSAKVTACFAEVRDHLCDFLRELPPPVVLPTPAKPEEMVVGAAAPAAPDLPIPDFAPKARPGFKLQLAADVEVKAIHLIRSACNKLDKIDAALIKDRFVAINKKEVMVDKNSPMRIALRVVAGGIAEPVNTIQTKAHDFVQDADLLQRLGAMKQGLQHKIAIMEEKVVLAVSGPDKAPTSRPRGMG
jgi:hypothetical protein